MTQVDVELLDILCSNRTIKGIEAMIMLVKKQIYFLNTSLEEQIKIINELFHLYS